MCEKDNRKVKQRTIKKRKGKSKMKRSDELDIDRISGLLQGFGWEVKRTEIKPLTLEIEIEKERSEPDDDICAQPS